MSSEENPTRQKILRAALALLEAGEGSAVRMSDIAKRAGISRQAVYLHYPNRAELLIAATRFRDQELDVDARLAESRSAATGVERLEAYIRAWGGYIPEIHGVGRALMAMQATDEEARRAWSDRMAAMRHGCAAAVTALDRDGQLAPGWSVEEATDMLWSLLSVRMYEHLRLDCGWSQEQYLNRIAGMARNTLVAA